MGFKLNLPLLNVALAGVAGGLGNKDQRSTQTTQATVSPEEAQLRAKLLGQYDTLTADPNLTGYEASQTQDINHLANLHAQNLQETLALHGISGPAEGAAMNGIDAGRFSDISRLRQGIPLLRNQLQTDNLNTGMQLMSTFPRGFTQNNKTAGSPLGGALGNAASTLAYFLGRGAFQPQQKSSNKPVAVGVPNSPPSPMSYPKFSTPPYMDWGNG